MRPPSLESLLTLLQHSDSQFPSGGFAFSAGLEGLVNDGLLHDRDLARLLDGWLRHRWAKFEQIFVYRAASRADDLPSLQRLDRELDAMLLSAPEREGSIRGGSALLAAHVRLGTPGASQLAEATASGSFRSHRTILEGALWIGAGVHLTQVRLMSAYCYISAASSAAVRLGICGALAQQRILAELIPTIAALCSEPIPDRRAAASFNPMADVSLMRIPGRDSALFAT